MLPKPDIIHRENDNISNVDFDKAYLAYKTAISLIEGIKKGDGLNPPNTVNFLEKRQAVTGRLSYPLSNRTNKSRLVL